MNDRRTTGDGSAVLWAILAIYSAWWIMQYSGFLFDPMLQADDARTSLFPLHRFGPEGALADDPIAGAMLAFTPPAVVALYRILIPAAGLFAATKIVQGICLVILAYAFVRIVRSHRAGLGPGVLLLFLFLHAPLLWQRGISGGLPRGFAFPLMALWAAGALTGRKRERWAAGILASLTYPSAMLIILAAEGLYAFRDGIDIRSLELRHKLFRYGLLVLVCGALLAPFFVAKSGAGRIHTLDEARKEPAFYRDGRLAVLPFRDPVKSFALFYARPLLPARGSVLEGVASLMPETPAELVIPLLFTLAGVLVWVRGRCPFPAVTVAFASGAVVLYLLSRMLAFRLYSPERFYSFTMPMAAIFLLVETVGLIGGRRPDPATLRRRHLGVAALIVLVLVINGDGIVAGKDGMTLDGREHAELYRFASGLPRDVLFASHPMDGDDIPLWAARSTLGGFETMQPWFIDSWRAQKERTFRTLDALYAVRREDVLAFCRSYGVTHILLRRERYGSDFAAAAHSFEPFDAYLAPKLASIRREELVLADPPGTTIVFSSDAFIVLSVDNLINEWTDPGASSSEPGV